MQRTKTPAPLRPLLEITFQKYLVNRPVREKRRRSYDPCEAVGGTSLEQIEALSEALRIKTPGLVWLLYGARQQARPAGSALPIADDEDLWSREARDAVQKHMQSLPKLTDEQRTEVTQSTIGQADNRRWHEERQWRITASLEDMRYGRMHEDTAVAAYVELMAAYDQPVHVHETGLHVHRDHSFIAASPDRVVTIGTEEGLLEVKCPPSKIGQTPEKACQDRKFCCELVNGDVRLKKTHAHFYQVQGQMAVTGHKWCDFVVWTNNKTVARSTNIETISFDAKFVERELMPGLLYFAEHALFPEVLTGRVRRRKDLVSQGKYVSYKKYWAGYYVVEDGHGLKKKLRKLV
ncbi:hypothetical protein HPB47_018319 [Ixodes persulcatus]|uniref:Uncharacterized protein n=1 Tax=Ixodes persulcatus TaxID=34615 RepID=A0AC60QL91_IXOPE|nr:hypothetical protein HPB47_018319 [Ixodes persulcatus]